MPKIVIDTGGTNFVLSEQAVTRLYELGSDYVKPTDENWAPGFSNGNSARIDGQLLRFGDAGYPPVRGNAWRTDPLLIHMVEELGDQASGWNSTCLEVVEIPSNIDWMVISNRDMSEWVQEKCSSGCRRWSSSYPMPPVHRPEGVIPYVLESELSVWERSYVGAMNFGGQCPIHDATKKEGNAFYLHDYERWYYWRMAHGDAWKEKVKTEWWYEFVQYKSLSI